MAIHTRRDLVMLLFVAIVLVAASGVHASGATKKKNPYGKYFQVVEFQSPEGPRHFLQPIYSLNGSGLPVVEPVKPSDLIHFNNDIYKKKGTNFTKIGVQQGFCSETVKLAAYECFFTFAFYKKDEFQGSLTVQGPFALDPKKQTLLAVNGGTGIFKGAAGEVTLQNSTPEPLKITYTFDLV